MKTSELVATASVDITGGSTKVRHPEVITDNKIEGIHYIESLYWIIRTPDGQPDPKSTNNTFGDRTATQDLFVDIQHIDTGVVTNSFSTQTYNVVVSQNTTQSLNLPVSGSFTLGAFVQSDHKIVCEIDGKQSGGIIDFDQDTKIVAEVYFIGRRVL